MTLAWPGSERSFGLFHFFFTSDQKTALIDRKLMAYKLNDAGMARKRAKLCIISFFFFTSDQKTALIDRKLMAYKLLRFQTVSKFTIRN